LATFCFFGKVFKKAVHDHDHVHDHVNVHDHGPVAHSYPIGSTSAGTTLAILPVTVDRGRRRGRARDRGRERLFGCGFAGRCSPLSTKFGAEQPTTFTFTPQDGINVHDYGQSNRERLCIFVCVGVDVLVNVVVIGFFIWLRLCHATPPW
jgi:hypothetical protein